MPAAEGEEKERRRRSSPAGLKGKTLGAAERRCRGEAVQGRAARVRRCRRSGRRLGEDAPATAAFSSSSSGSPPPPPPLSLGCGDGGRENRGAGG
jgi:hypothetical protein